ncbi:MAG: DUF378 domain-containing protein [Clostridia bacterium]|nr:DUF378 domain-containing protein [Clostridia bacterium]
MKSLNLVSFIILAIGGLNWLSVGVFQFDIIAGIFGSTANIVSRILYILVGIATLYLIYVSIVEKGKIEMCEEYKQIKSAKSINN